MNLAPDLGEWLQNRMLWMNDDCNSAAALLSGKLDSIPDCTIGRWQLGVDFIYRCLQSGLFSIWNSNISDEIDSFIRNLANNNPFVKDTALTWHVEYLAPTPYLREIMGKYDLKMPMSGNEMPLFNERFISDLLALFAASGVPWSEAPLVPVESGKFSETA